MSSFEVNTSSLNMLNGVWTEFNSKLGVAKAALSTIRGIIAELGNYSNSMYKLAGAFNSFTNI